MVKLSYQEINKLINRTSATFYISGVPEKDCVNTGDQVLYDYRKKKGDNSVIIIRHYEELEASREFNKRPLSLTFMLLMFGYLFAMIYLFIQLCSDYQSVSMNSWLLFASLLLIPGVIFYPITRKRIFLYKVLGYDVDTFSDVISWVFFILQMSTIIAIASGINIVLAHYSGYDRVTSIIACLMIVSIIISYVILVHTSVFKPGKSIIKFNHHKKLGKKNNDVTNNNTADFNVLDVDNVEVEESTGDLEEIRDLIGNSANKSDIDFDFLDNDNVVLDSTKTINLSEIETGEKFEEIVKEPEKVTPFEKIMDNIVSSGIDPLIISDNSDMLVDKDLTLDAVEYIEEDDFSENEELEDSIESNINSMKNVIDNK